MKSNRFSASEAWLRSPATLAKSSLDKSFHIRSIVVAFTTDAMEDPG